MLKIDKSVPLEANQSSSAGKYPLREMEVGDSFLLPLVDGSVAVTRSRVSGRAAQVGKDLGRKFVTRVVEGGVRVWRVS